MINGIKEFGSYKPVKFSLPESSVSFDNVLCSAIPDKWTPLKLLEVSPYNSDTSIFRFELPSGQEQLQLPTFSYLLVLAPGCERNGEDAVRPYASISDESARGYFEIIVKRYDQWGIEESPTNNILYTRTNHSYRPAGVVSNYIHDLKRGEFLQFRRNLRIYISLYECNFVTSQTIALA